MYFNIYAYFISGANLPKVIVIICCARSESGRLGMVNPPPPPGEAQTYWVS